MKDCDWRNDIPHTPKETKEDQPDRQKHQNTVVCSRVCMPIYSAPKMPFDENAERMSGLTDLCEEIKL